MHVRAPSSFLEEEPINALAEGGLAGDMEKCQVLLLP